MESVRPSKKQRELLSYIEGFIKGHGYGPSYREIMSALNYKSVSTVAVHIDELIKKGYLVKRERSARSLEVVKSGNGGAEPASAKDDTWLLETIEAKFVAAESTMTQKLIDDLYVLVGALHVLELSSSHKKYKKRLLTLVKDTA